MTRSLGEIIRLLLDAGWRRRYLICIPIVLMIPLSILGSRYAPKTYEARTIFLLQETGKENPFLKDFIVGLQVKERISALRILVKSEHVLLNVLKDMRTPEELADPRRTAMEMRELAGAITLELIGTDLMELRFRGSEPVGMGKTLSAIKQRFLERLLSPERSTLASTRRFLADQLEERKNALESAERELSDLRIRYADKLPVLYASNIQRLATMQQQLQERMMELASARANVEAVKQQLIGSNPIVSRLEESIVQVTSDLASLRARYTLEHSEVQSAQRKLVWLQAERQTYLSATHAIDGADLDRLMSMAAATTGAADKAPPLLVSQVLRLQEARSRQATLEKDAETLAQSVNDLQRSIAEFAPIEQFQSQLEKKIASAREVYQSFSERYDKASTSYALGQFEEPERIKVIDAPQDPSIPITLPKILFVVMGIVAGLVLGISLAIVGELLDSRLRTNEHFFRMTGAPVLGRLPRAAHAA